MAENDSPTPAPEAVQQTPPESPSEVPSVEGMLSAIPGFDQYFGDEQKSEKPTEEPAPGGEEATPEVTAEAESETPEALEEAKEDGEKEETPYQKRIDKLTAQKHEALEKLEKAEARVKELEAHNKALPVLNPTPKDPLTNVQSVPELEQKLIDARKVKMWALENLDGGQVQQGDGVADLDGSQVKKLLATAEDMITNHIPRRLQYLENRTQHDQEARKHYPNFFKTDTEEYQLLQKWVQLLPEVMNFPDFRLIIADGLAGQRMRLAKNAQKNGAPAKPTPLAAPQPSGAPRTAQKSVLSKDLLNRIATDRRALDMFSESLIGTGGSKK